MGYLGQTGHLGTVGYLRSTVGYLRSTQGYLFSRHHGYLRYPRISYDAKILLDTPRYPRYPRIFYDSNILLAFLDIQGIPGYLMMPQFYFHL